MTAFITIRTAGGTSWWEVPYPSDYRVVDQPIYSSQSQRDAKGTMHLDLIAVKAQVTATWSAMSPAAFKRLCDVTGSGMPVDVRYFDPQANAVRGTAANPVSMYRDTSFAYAPVGGWRTAAGAGDGSYLPDSGADVALRPKAYNCTITLTEMRRWQTPRWRISRPRWRGTPGASS
jgi:hypothetical protein